MADWETRAVRSDGCRIAYDCRQGEGPEVVLLHGYGLDRTMWAPQLAAAAAVVVLHLWKRNNLLSIFGGTVLYMVLVQSVFV